MKPVTPESDSNQFALPLRRRGAQPGNLNALKHGRYLVGGHINQVASVDPSQLIAIEESISAMKKYMNVVYKVGLQATNLAEANQNLRSLSMAAIGLTRLMNLHQRISLRTGSSDDTADPGSQTECLEQTVPPNELN